MNRSASVRICLWLIGLLVVGGLGVSVVLYRLGSDPAPRAESARVLGFGTFDRDNASGLALMSLPDGKTLARLQDLRGQADALALSADGTRAYLLDQTRLFELDVASLRVVHSVELPEAIQLLGSMDTIAVAPDDQHVYVETMRIVGPQRWDPQLRVGQPDSQYGLATYDVAQARFTGEIQLAGPWCGGADLHTLDDGRLVLWCSTSHQVRLVDPRQSAETGALSINGAGMTVSRAGHRGWVIDSSGSIHELDLDGLIEVRSVRLNPNTSGAAVPLQQPQLTSDGARMLVLAAPGNVETRARGLGTAVWVVDTSTLQVVANVPLPSPVSHVAPTANGHSMLVMLDSGDSLTSRSMRLLDILSGREEDRWPGVVVGLHVL